MSLRHDQARAWVVCLALLAAGCGRKAGASLPSPLGSGTPAPSIPRLAELESASPGSAASSSRSAWTGTLAARSEAQLGPKMTGNLSQIAVEEGDRVRKGQLLFRLDAAQAALGVSQAKAALASAQVGLDAAKLDLSRATELAKHDSIAPAQLDQARSASDRAQAAVELSKVALQMAERAAADTAVVSPIDGVVTAKLKSVGETVTMMPPTIVIVVQDVDRLELRARVPEKALASLAEGQAIRMTVPTVGTTREVLVKRIHPTIDLRTRTVEIVAEVDNADRKLKVGMLVEVALATKAP